MDRLPHLTPAGHVRAGLLATGLLLFGACMPACDGGDGESPVPRRVDAVPAAPRDPLDLDDFCEVRPDPASAPKFAWPALTSAAPPRSSGWTWVNVWATWCSPCVEELPMILQWPEKMAARGRELDLVLLSVDEDAATVRGFRAKHSWLPRSLQATGPDLIPGWLASQGLDLPATLPLHIFVDPTGAVRCGRSGALQADAIDAIDQLIAADRPPRTDRRGPTAAD